MSEPTRILVIDDEESIRFAFHRYFEARGYAVTVAAGGQEGLARYREIHPAVVFLDVRLGDSNGLDVLARLREEDPDASVIIITAYSSLETVTRAIRTRAFDFLVKPLDLDRAAELAAQAVACRAAMQAFAAVNRDEADTSGRTRLVGASPAMQEVYKSIGKAALADATVLITGDTGTGKEVVARAIHENSSRRDRPFVAVNCGALPENLVESELFGYVRGAFSGADTDKPGRFESADGGTLFLDEIGELPLAAQVKLLRFLDTHTIERLGSVKSAELDVRIAAATNRDLTVAVETGQFREDLFYRLAVIQIEVPPLVARAGDIIPLARHFLDQATPAGQPTPPISEEAGDALRRYDWPGNVRQLRNAIEHAALMSGGGPILLHHLPETVRQRKAPPVPPTDERGRVVEQYLAGFTGSETDLHRLVLEPLERALIQRVLAECGGNQSAAAARLGLHRNTLRQKLRQYGIDPGGAQ